LPFTNQASIYYSGGNPVTWGLENPPDGVTIDQTGLITVAEEAELQESNAIVVTAIHEGKTYKKAFNITKVVDGSNPIILDLVNDNKTIACDEDGLPLPGALPFNTMAILYRGNSIVTEGVTWRLENTVPGVSINENGLITAESGAEFGDNNDIAVIATLNNVDYTAIFTVSKAYAGESILVIDLDNQNRDIPCDMNGNPKPGQLPLIINAELYRGIKKISGLAENMTAYYPVAGGGDLFDPMLGDFFPTTSAVLWSLINAPSGVTISKENGTITVAKNAELDVKNDITVQATWRGRTFTTLLTLRKAFDGDKGDPGPQGDPAPHYRGRTYTPGGVTGLVTIQVSPTDTQTVQMFKGDWVAYVGETAGIWVKGLCMRWDGATWEQIPIDASGSFDTNPYVQALMDLTEGAPGGTFMTMLVRDLVAKTAMIEYIASHKLHIQIKDGNSGAIYGGGFDANGNPTSGSGFYLGTDGRLKAVDGEFAGKITSTSGSLIGALNAKNVTVNGTVTSGTNYLLKAENSYAFMNNPKAYLPMKAIATTVKGSCYIKSYFTTPNSTGNFRLSVNGAILDSGVVNASQINFANVPLNNEYNIIIMEFIATAEPGVGCTNFELWVADDPGLLRAL
jgi:hypothetical protein